MQQFPLNLGKRLQTRKEQDSFRTLKDSKDAGDLVDFSSNDYLGFSRNKEIYDRTSQILLENRIFKNGAGGSRLLSGNHFLYQIAEKTVADVHQAAAAVIYNSGYDANIGFFSSVPQRGDVVIYDELSHASIRDGISLGNARAFKFSHLDLKDLEEKILRVKNASFEGDIYIVTEAVFSMDGDIPNLHGLVELSEKYNCLPVIDEAHSVGVIGNEGKGLVVELSLQDSIFARLITFGKALGAHGAAVLGSRGLKDYLVNFSRSLIYTTALPPHSVATILSATNHLQKDGQKELEILRCRIRFFTSEVIKCDLQDHFISGFSAIHSCIIPGNEKVKRISAGLQKEGFDVKPILSPTVPKGEERLRFCLHSFNSEKELSTVVSLLARLIS